MAHSWWGLARTAASVLVLVQGVAAQNANLGPILERLDRLEEENRKLRDEVSDLRARLDGNSNSSQSVAPSIEERVEVAEQRIEEQQQTKVESSQRVPVKLKGMLLFNAFSSGRNGIPADFPTVAVGARGPNTTRATMRQTTIGLEVQSPFTVAGAQARGEVVMDFYGMYDDYPAPRLRTGFLDLQWPSTALRVGVEKPIVSQRNPSSLAQVIYPEMWGSGNLWLWLPQARLEQKFRIAGTDVTWQGGLLQTNDQRTVPPNSGLTLQPRPGWETRVAVGRDYDEDRGWQFAPGFHYSRTLVGGTSLPSQLITGDWRIAPLRQVELTGAFFTGRNAGPIGGLRQGIVQTGPGQYRAVATTGGWTQLMLRPFDRLRFHLIAGEQDDRRRDLRCREHRPELLMGRQRHVSARTKCTGGYGGAADPVLRTFRPIADKGCESL